MSFVYNLLVIFAVRGLSQTRRQSWTMKMHRSSCRNAYMASGIQKARYDGG